MCPSLTAQQHTSGGKAWGRWCAAELGYSPGCGHGLGYGHSPRAATTELGERERYRG